MRASSPPDMASLTQLLWICMSGCHAPAVNIAQHSYFNLAGHASGSTILDHVVGVR